MLNADYNIGHLTQVCESVLNDASVTKEDSKRGGVKTVSKGLEFRFNESTQSTYVGKANNASRFMSWHDDVARLFKKHGDPHTELTTAFLPVSVKFWLDATFAKPDAAPSPDNTPPSNGGREVTPAVAPAPAASSSKRGKTPAVA